MKRIKANLLGIIGLLACGAISVSDMVSMLAAGPDMLSAGPTLLADVMIAAAPLRSAGSTLYPFYLLTYALSALVFAWAFWSCSGSGARRAPVAGSALLGLQIAIALLTDTQLLVVVTIGLAYGLPARRAALWMAFEMTAYCALRIARLTGAFGRQPPNLVDATLEVGMGLTWMALAFGAGYLAASERRGRLRLASLHADLKSTQHLMMDALRLSERARISRNLHDVMGHHLTALNLHLELALRQAGTASAESLQVSRQLAKDLLREVRAVVSLDYEDRFLDLRTSLQLLVDAIPSPQVTLHYDETIAIAKPENAHVILRCVQEGVTNAVRHAGASLVEVHVSAHAGNLSIRVIDDGRGTAGFKDGNGLRGMRERIQALHGTLDIQRRSGGGVDLHALLPAGDL